MQSNILTLERKDMNQNPENGNIVPNNTKEATIFKSNSGIDSGIKASRFLSFLTSKAGIITISSIVVAVTVGVSLGVALSKNKDEETDNNINKDIDKFTDKVTENEQDESTEEIKKLITHKISEGTITDKIPEGTITDKIPTDKISEGTITDKIPTDKITEGTITDKIPEGTKTDKIPTDKITEGTITDKITEEKITDKITEAKITDKINEDTKEIENKDYYVYKGKLSSDVLYVKKVDNLPEDFILGMDISSVISEENSGVKYYDFNGEEKDLMEVLRYVGINYIRIRIWNDPYDSEGHAYGGGNNDMNTAIQIGKRATKYGMKILASFHYSDFYADPGIQKVPKAWEGKSVEEKAVLAEEFTKESLKRFKDEGVDVGMVAIGNEINLHFCGEREWDKIVTILKGCSKGTREVLPDALISVHFTNPEKEGNMKYCADSLNTYGLDYDAFSTSYYSVWHKDLSSLNSLNEVANTYNKKIYIAETQYPYTRENLDYYPNKTPGYDDFLYYPLTVQGQANHIRDLINHVKGLNNNIGIFYWEGAWIAVGTNNWAENNQKWETYGSGWASSYSASYDSVHFAGGGASTENQAMFDSDGKPLESLKVFNLVKYGNEVNTFEDGVEDISVNPFDFSSFSLPNSINVIYTNNQKISRDVTWDGELDKTKAQTDEEYNYKGNAGNIQINCKFEKNTNTANLEKRCVCSYFIGDKILSPWKEKSMIRIREL